MNFFLHEKTPYRYINVLLVSTFLFFLLLRLVMNYALGRVSIEALQAEERWGRLVAATDLDAAVP